MFPLFHIFIPLLFYELIQFSSYKNRIRLNRLSLIIGSMFPDLLDKPLIFIMEEYSGRSLGHSPFLIIIIFSLFFILEKKSMNQKRNLAYSFLIGAIFHIIMDIPHVPWLYPFLEYDFILIDDPLSSWWKSLFENKTILFTEIMGFVGIILIFIKNEEITKNKENISELVKNFLWENVNDKKYIL